MINLPEVGQIFDEKYAILGILGSGGLGAIDCQ
jgi:hypothetical protein